MVLILGGGLAGLSTAYHLRDCPHLVIEAEKMPGGLCRSREVEGFTFDYTGHLLHLRDERIIRLIDDLLPGAFNSIERRSRIRSRGVTLPFPFQANLHGLPVELVADCLVGFIESMPTAPPESSEASFEEWSLAVFGRGISEAFMFPYSRKLFRREASEMTADWVSWAVPKPSLEEVVRGALGVENRGMGYNPEFRYPKRGGIGILPEALAERVPDMRLDTRVVGVDLETREVHLEGGETLSYDRLVVTIPLPAFLKIIREERREYRELADSLDWSVVGCLNLGVDRERLADGVHWIYFPDREAPFYRVGFPANFSSTVAPPGTSSMYVEFGLKRDERFDPQRLEGAAMEALRREGILSGGDRVIARDYLHIDPGYVIFDRARQEVLARLVPELESRGVHVIGRYGAWTYSYMERALIDGMELAARLEGTWTNGQP
jgi:protoporphyrinogen oxidase